MHGEKQFTSSLPFLYKNSCQSCIWILTTLKKKPLFRLLISRQSKRNFMVNNGVLPSQVFLHVCTLLLFLWSCINTLGGTVVQWLVLPHSKKHLGSKLPLDWSLSVSLSLHVLPEPGWVSSACSAFHPQPKDVRIKSTGYSKLRISVNVRVNDRLSVLALW